MHVGTVNRINENLLHCGNADIQGKSGREQKNRSQESKTIRFGIGEQPPERIPEPDSAG
ncbi:hypothetical protein D3C81_2305720 [compost metagenome]